MDLTALKNVPYFMDVFTKWTAEYPDATMVVDDQYYRGWTRSHVDDVSGQIYHYLKRQGIGTGDFVLINLPRGVLPIIAMIGIWKAGAAFVVVEDTYAPERIAFIREDCGCKAEIDLETMKGIAENEEKLDGYVVADDHDAAFAIYTSGSTGRPKGVLHEFGNVKLDALVSHVEVPNGARGAIICPLNFIAAIKSITAALYAPCCFYVVPYATVKNPRKLMDYYIDNKINLTFFSPSLIRAVGDDLGPYLKLVHTGSEPANGISLKGARLVNNYSMSEAAFTVCQFEIDRPYEICPVGKPQSDLITIRLVDENDNDVAPGETGEIIFENPFMRGYINLPEQTSEALRNGWYHTGDLGRFDDDGNLILVGRANDMIKIDGNRIEPAEIEAAFKKVTGKDFAAAKGFEDPNDSFVAIYYMGELEQSENEIRKAMSQYIPYYMIPAFFMQIERPPLLPNGKMARKELPDPRAALQRAEYVAPRNEFEESLCKAFEESLGIDNIGITEDFYQLGGSSVNAMQVLSIMGIDDLSAIDIYQGRTVEKIAELYAEKQDQGTTVSEEEKEMEARKQPRELPPVQQNCIDYQLFTPSAPMWLFPFLFSFGENADAEHVLDAARKTQLQHPIFATVFEFSEDAELQQRYDPSKMEELEIEHMSDEEFKEFCEGQIENFQILGAPMIKMRVIETDSNCYLLIVFHHVAMDGSSMQLIFQNFSNAYLGKPMELDTYYSFLEDEEKLRRTSIYRNARQFFNDNYDGVEWNNIIEPDKDEPGNVAAMRIFPTELTAEKMTTMEKSCDFTRNGFMIAVASLALARTNGNNDVLSLFAFHNRTDARKQRAAGFMALALPLGLHLDELETVDDLYKAIIDGSNQSIANSSYDWATKKDNPFVKDTIALAYEGAAITDMSALEAMNASMVPIDAHNEAALRRNFLQFFERGDTILVRLTYMANIYSDEKIEAFGEAVTDIANRLIEVDDPKSVKVADLLA